MKLTLWQDESAVHVNEFCRKDILNQADATNSHSIQYLNITKMSIQQFSMASNKVYLLFHDILLETAIQTCFLLITV